MDESILLMKEKINRIEKGMIGKNGHFVGKFMWYEGKKLEP
jgi:hypothetical protein